MNVSFVEKNILNESIVHLNEFEAEAIGNTALYIGTCGLNKRRKDDSHISSLRWSYSASGRGHNQRICWWDSESGCPCVSQTISFEIVLSCEKKKSFLVACTLDCI